MVFEIAEASFSPATVDTPCPTNDLDHFLNTEIGLMFIQAFVCTICHLNLVGVPFSYFRDHARSVFIGITLASNTPIGLSIKGRYAKSSTPLIVVVTPTYDRPTRMPDLIRLSNTLTNLDHIHWIVVEDAWGTETSIRNFLNDTGIPFTYLATETAEEYPKKGWSQRNFALDYIRNNIDQLLQNHTSGVLYFADDDNSYDRRLFEIYVRNVKVLGMWAVGTVGGAEFEAPIVKDGMVIGFNVKFYPERIFPTDMAGMAINLREVLRTDTTFGKDCHGFQHSPETCLLEEMGFGHEDIEPFEGGTNTLDDILVWHTKSGGILRDPKRWTRLANIDEVILF